MNIIGQKTVIFAGTTEGRRLSEAFASAGIRHRICVATEYGRLVMKQDPLVTVHEGRMDETEMETFIKENADIVYDATHPFARIVTENIRQACEKTGAEYVRIIRDDRGAEVSPHAGDKTLNAGDEIPHAAEKKGLSDTQMNSGADHGADYVCGRCEKDSGDYDAGCKTRSGKDSVISYFDDAKSCAEALKETEGNILLTTGSKEVSVYAQEPSVRERLFARVLPTEESIKLCTDAGVPARQVIGMHGPFSAELNEAMIKQYDIKWLVTKQSGSAGGYYDKLFAADQTGISVFVIGRPEREEGFTVGEVLRMRGIYESLHVTLIGCGPGGRGLMTAEAAEEIENADAVFGSSRLIEGIRGKKKYPYYLAKDVIPVLESGDIRRAAVLFSGDSGFYSGTEKMYAGLSLWAETSGLNLNMRICPGISSLSYLSARAGQAYQDFPFLSLHGRSDEKTFISAVEKIRTNEKVFLILSGAEDVRRIGEALIARGLEHCSIVLGYELSNPEEEIRVLTPGECIRIGKKGLYAAIILNPDPESGKIFPFISDEDFIRSLPVSKKTSEAYRQASEKIVPESAAQAVPCSVLQESKDAKDRKTGTKNDAPMTKEMVRHASIIRLKLSEGAVLYDIGSGTGSVSVEAALFDPSITVYAIERKKAALELTKINAQKFACRNLVTVEGEAPEALSGLEAPTHVFIGGSNGKLKEITEVLKSFNRRIRIVINCISLETIAEAQVVIKKEKITDLQIEQLSVSKARELGNYHLMMGENPVMIFSFDLNP